MLLFCIFKVNYTKTKTGTNRLDCWKESCYRNRFQFCHQLTSVYYVFMHYKPELLTDSYFCIIKVQYMQRPLRQVVQSQMNVNLGPLANTSGANLFLSSAATQTCVLNNTTQVSSSIWPWTNHHLRETICYSVCLLLCFTRLVHNDLVIIL